MKERIGPLHVFTGDARLDRYQIRERAPYLGETRLTIGEPTWKTLDRETVETLVGQEV